MSVLGDLLGAGDFIKEIGATVRQVLPNPEAQHAFDLQIAELANKADERENNLVQGQIDVNKIEAGNPNWFVSGWRPFIGWVGGTALGYTWIVSPLFHLQALDPSAIYPIIIALLGIGGMRTYEKVQGVATASVKA